MSEVSSGLDNASQSKDQVKRNKTADKSLKSRLKNAAGKAILRVPPLVAVLTSGTIDTPHFPAPEPPPAVAQAPDFKSENAETLQSFTPQASEQNEIKELESPADLIPEEELKERFGIKIFQLKGDIELGFRRGAEKDGLFQQLEKMRDTKETYIFLVNGHYADPQFLTSEQRAALNDEAGKMRIRSLTSGLFYAKEDAKKWFEEKKGGKITDYHRLLQELENKRSMLSQERYEVERQALEFQYAPFLKGPTDEDLISASEKTVGGNIGEYVNKNGKQIVRYYVFLAVKDMERTRKFKVGDEEIEVLKPGFEGDVSYKLSPDPSQSHPSPDTLTVDTSHPTYPIRKGWTAGTIARHELRHLRGSPHPRADLDLISDIDTAYQNYKNNGDDSGYWVVFKTPKGPVITEKEAPNAKSSALI